MKSPTGASLYGCVPSANNAVTTPVQPEVECAAVHAVHVHAREDPMCPDTRSCRMASRRIMVAARNLTSPPDMQKKIPRKFTCCEWLADSERQAAYKIDRRLRPK